jgi:hypothetical protein
MPLTDLQRSVLHALARCRSQDSFFAGGATLNAKGPRFSKDFGIFHDSANRLAVAAENDPKHNI